MSEAASQSIRAEDGSTSTAIVLEPPLAQQMAEMTMDAGQQTPSSNSRLAQPPQPVRQKKSSFQITSVTVGSRLSNDGGEDSADDLDESHTEDLSSDVLDISKVTDYEYSTSEEAFSAAAAIASNDVASEVRQPAVSLFTAAVATTSLPSNVSVTVVESPNIPLSAVQHPEIQWQNRFRVVKIESSEPFRRGRWLCMDFLDPPPPSSAQSELGDASSTAGGSGQGHGQGGHVPGGAATGTAGGVAVGGYGNSGSGNSSGTGSMQHGESLVLDSASGLVQQYPATSSALWSSSDLNAAGYPVSIILQTQQQGNLDFTNTALHMHGRTASTSGHPPAGSFTISAVNTGAPCNEFQQQQQQKMHHQQPQSDYQIGHLVNPSGSSSQVGLGQQPSTADYVEYALHPQQQSSVPAGSAVLGTAQQPPVPAAVVQMVQMDVSAAAQSQGLVLQQQQQHPVQVQSNVASSLVVNAPSQQSQRLDQRDQAGQVGATSQVPGGSAELQDRVAASTQDAAQTSQNGGGAAPVVPIGASAAAAAATTAAAVSTSTSSVEATTTTTSSSAASATTASAPLQDQTSSAVSGEEDDGERLKVLAASLEDGVRSANQQSCHDPPSVNLKYSASGASTVAIDNKIEQAMDLVKSHLMFAVREEVDVLKERITELMDRIGQLEYENSVLRAGATPDTLAKLAQQQTCNPSAT